MNTGDIYLCDFGKPLGHRPGFIRPAMIISADKINIHGTPIVIPITRTRRGYPTRIEITEVLSTTSYLECESLTCVAGEQLIKRLGKVDEITLDHVRQIIRNILDL